LTLNAYGLPSATERCVEALVNHFNDTKNTLFHVVNDADGQPYTTLPNTDPPHGLLADIYLPDLDFVKRNLIPGAIAKNETGQVVAYVGPTNGFDDEDSFYMGTSEGHSFDATLPYAAKILFSRAANKPVIDPLQPARHLELRTITGIRAQYYLGALVATLYKHVHHIEGARRHSPVKSFPLQSAVNYINDQGDFQQVLVAEAYYEFDLTQYQNIQI
jgi:hypothetical protein